MPTQSPVDPYQFAQPARVGYDYFTPSPPSPANNPLAATQSGGVASFAPNPVQNPVNPTSTAAQMTVAPPTSDPYNGQSPVQMPWMVGQNLPNGNNAPYANPVGSQDGINANWAFLTSTKYNPQTNANLQATYEEQLRQFAANGNRRWVGTVDNGHWDTTPPPPPIFTSTDYNENLNWTNANTPGQPGYAQADPSFLNPYVNQDPIYAGTLTPWTTANTNLAKVYEDALPNAGKPQTVTNPGGLLPSEQGFSANEVYAGQPGSQINPRQNPVYDFPGAVNPTGFQYAVNPIVADSQTGSTPLPTNPAAGGLGGDITSIADLLAGLIGLGGGSGQNASPFFNNNRSLFYPNTNRGEVASQTPNPLQGRGTYGGINVAQLLAQLFGSR